MKIISKYKDYYDYLVGIYGIDPMLTLDRRYDNILHYNTEIVSSDTLQTKVFAIAGKKYVVHYYKGKSYHTVEECKVLRKLKYTQSWRDPSPDYEAKGWAKRNGVPTKVNFKYRIPVLIQTSGKNWTVWKPVIMKDWDLHKVMTPEQAYQEISGFLGYLVDHPALPDNQTNIGKLESHGFDKKISFRHRKG